MTRAHATVSAPPRAVRTLCTAALSLPPRPAVKLSARRSELPASASVVAAASPQEPMTVARLFSAARRAAAAPSAMGRTLPLTWNDYFHIRRRRRLVETLMMVSTTFVGLTGGSAYFLTKELAPGATYFGLEPFMAYSLGTVGCGLVGLLAGPLVGSWSWKLLNKDVVQLIEEKDKEFFKRIAKYRSHSSSNSIRNPIPDFYGEKIKSVKDYRAWLRKQREHVRKSQFHIGEE